MSVEERIRRCLILEEMKNNRQAAENLGLRNTSKVMLYQKYMGQSIEKEREDHGFF